MKTEFNYIEIENNKDDFKTHAGIHAQLDVYSPCRLIFIIEWGLHISPHQREILSSRIQTPFTNIWQELYNQFSIGEGVHTRTKNERRYQMYSFVDLITATATRGDVLTDMQLEYLSMLACDAQRALQYVEKLRTEINRRKNGKNKIL